MYLLSIFVSYKKKLSIKNPMVKNKNVPKFEQFVSLSNATYN